MSNTNSDEEPSETTRLIMETSAIPGQISRTQADGRSAEPSLGTESDLPDVSMSQHLQ